LQSEETRPSCIPQTNNSNNAQPKKKDTIKIAIILTVITNLALLAIMAGLIYQFVATPYLKLLNMGYDTATAWHQSEINLGLILGFMLTAIVGITIFCGIYCNNKEITHSNITTDGKVGQQPPYGAVGQQSPTAYGVVVGQQSPTAYGVVVGQQSPPAYGVVGQNLPLLLVQWHKIVTMLLTLYNNLYFNNYFNKIFIVECH